VRTGHHRAKTSSQQAFKLPGVGTLSGLSTRTILVGLVLIGIAFVAVGSASILTWEYSNSNDFCTNACHKVHPEEPIAHKLSQHANVHCVECHIGRMSFFPSALEKSGHIAHAWSLLVGYERPTVAKSLQSSRSCESCHIETSHRDNTIRVIKHFDNDRANSESKITLVMRLIGRNFGREDSLGLNWHASGAVRYRADDKQRLDVTWVEATLPDGTKRVYENVRAKTGNPHSQTPAGSLRTMDCSTCHNRVGHPFPNPEDVVDAALGNGTLSRNLPYIKKHLMALIKQQFSTEQEARTQVRQAIDNYLAEYPDLTVKGIDNVRTYLTEREDRLVNLKVRSYFPESRHLSWESFPDNTGHRDGPGCFRCHNGRLQTAEGVPIPVNCTTCHSIPLVTRRDRVPTYYTDLIDVRKPASHRDPAFMAKHMDLAEESCEACHGSIKFGENDKSHCSNSACHAENWQYLDFDALRMAKPLAIPKPGESSHMPVGDEG